MKFAFVTLGLLLSISISISITANATESLSEESLYKALNTKEVDAFPTMPGRIFSKSVGGITCTKSINGKGALVYTCGLDKVDSFCRLKVWEQVAGDDPRLPICGQ